MWSALHPQSQAAIVILGGPLLACLIYALADLFLNVLPAAKGRM